MTVNNELERILKKLVTILSYNTPKWTDENHKKISSQDYWCSRYDANQALKLEALPLELTFSVILWNMLQDY
jgi:hypothetical protein